MKTFTKVFEFWENLGVPFIILPLDEVSTHMFVVLFDEFARFDVQHLHIRLTLDFFIVSNRLEKVIRAVLNLHNRETSVIVRHEPVYAPDDFISGPLYGTYVIPVEGLIHFEVGVNLSSLILVADTMVGVECLADVLFGGVQFITLETTSGDQLVRDGPSLLLH